MSLPFDSQANYCALLQNIAELATKYGRDPNEICLLAVTKGHSWHEIEPLYDAGQRLFAESRQQEAAPKMALAPHDAKWHFIGTLQQNKVRKIIGNFTLIHSVDSLELATKISSCSCDNGIATEILLQVNTSGELTKHGLDVEGWRRHIDAIHKLPGIILKGLMTMAPLSDDEVTVRSCFAKLREFRDELENGEEKGKELLYLSMGMSHDYPWAIAEGATHLRIGSALFETK